MELPTTTARSISAASSDSSAREAALDIVITSPAPGVPPKPGMCGAATGHRPLNAESCDSHILASSGQPWRNRIPSLIEPAPICDQPLPPPPPLPPEPFPPPEPPDPEPVPPGAG